MRLVALVVFALIAASCSSSRTQAGEVTVSDVETALSAADPTAPPTPDPTTAPTPSPFDEVRDHLSNLGFVINSHGDTAPDPARIQERASRGQYIGFPDEVLGLLAGTKFCGRLRDNEEYGPSPPTNETIRVEECLLDFDGPAHAIRTERGIDSTNTTLVLRGRSDIWHVFSQDDFGSNEVVRWTRCDEGDSLTQQIEDNESGLIGCERVTG